MSLAFQDLFSAHSATYALTRPQYPKAVFAWLADQAPALDAAWDCGTGNGQAAVGLAGYFGQVYATDASAAQIEKHIPNPRVEYSVRLAEESGFADAGFASRTPSTGLIWINSIPRPGAC